MQTLTPLLGCLLTSLKHTHRYKGPKGTQFNLLQDVSQMNRLILHCALTNCLVCV